MFYVKKGFSAFRHLSHLFSGLYSQVPGENHIVAQIKEAMASGIEKNWAGSIMKDWVSKSLHIAKHIRKDTSPFLKNNEIEDLCLKFVKRNHKTKKVIIIGTGVIGSGLIEKFLSDGFYCLWFFNKNKPAISSGDKNIRLLNLKNIKNHLNEADVLISCTGSREYVITREHADSFNGNVKNSVIDLSVPANVDPYISVLSPSGNIRVINLDDLKHWYRREMADMDNIFRIADRAVLEHKNDYDKIISSFQGGNEKQQTCSYSVE